MAEDIDIFAVLTADTLNTESWILDTVALGGLHAAYILRFSSRNVTFRWPGADTWPVSPWRPVMFPVARCVKADTRLVPPRRPCHLSVDVPDWREGHPVGWPGRGEVGLGNLDQG